MRGEQQGLSHHRVRCRLPLFAAALLLGTLALGMLQHDARAEGPRQPAPTPFIAHDARSRYAPACDRTIGAELFSRTELFFGLSRPGGVVTEAEFKAFVDLHVTPRFPDGLSLLSGQGQYRESDGTLVGEGSKLLILLYPRRDREASRKIEQIRSDYKRMFQQQSVLRTDALSCVSFGAAKS